eukprot:11875207-Alexandrium_andersonii.AAC.1
MIGKQFPLLFDKASTKNGERPLSYRGRVCYGQATPLEKSLWKSSSLLCLGHTPPVPVLKVGDMLA